MSELDLLINPLPAAVQEKIKTLFEVLDVRAKRAEIRANSCNDRAEAAERLMPSTDVAYKMSQLQGFRLKSTFESLNHSMKLVTEMQMHNNDAGQVLKKRKDTHLALLPAVPLPPFFPLALLRPIELAAHAQLVSSAAPALLPPCAAAPH
jgi:hypothetical protein